MCSRAKDNLRCLQNRCSALQRQLNKLSLQKQDLCCQVAVLDGLCASFSILQVGKEFQSIVGEVLDESNQAELHQLRSDLLQLATSSTPAMNGSAEAPTAVQVPAVLEADTEVRRIAPRTSQMDFLNHLASLPPTQDVSSIQIAGLLRDAVLHGGLQLHARQLGQAPAEAVNDTLSVTWQRFMHAMFIAVLSGRTEVVGEITLMDLARMQPDHSAGEGAADKLSALLPQLGLSQLQLQDIAAGGAVFSSLLNGLLPQHQRALAALADDSGSGGSSAGSSAESFNSFADGLGARTQQTRRLRIVLRKEVTLKAAMLCWFIGCLSWEQFTKANVFTWPHPLRLPVLMQLIVHQYEQQQQQQQR